jgi:signal transduction histidine kinase
VVERLDALHDLDIELTMDLAYERQQQPTRLAPETETIAYRLVQEALTNVIKHADARHTQVKLTENEQTVDISVRDDGRGFSTTDTTDGYGLLGMRERVSLAGGELEIESAPGAGCTIRASLPAVRADQTEPAAPTEPDSHLGEAGHRRLQSG